MNGTAPRRRWSWIAPAVALPAGAAIILLAQAIMRWRDLPRDGVQFEVESTVLLCAGFLLVAAVGAYVQHVRLRRAGRWPAVAAGAGIAIGVGGVVLSVLMIAIAGGLRQDANIALPIGSLALGTLTVLIQSLGEEVFLRGWLQQAMLRSVPAAVAVTVTTAVFLLLHLIGGWREPLTMINLFLGGLLFGLLAVRTGGMIAPIAAHFGWNWAEQLGFGLGYDHDSGPFGSLLKFDLTGAPMWGGSVEGLNASVAMTFVLAALILPVLAWRSPAPSGAGARAA